MKIILNSIRLKNFKGVVGEKRYEFGEHITRVKGRNSTGKTTIHDAFLWVLFDKNTEGATKFGVKPRDAKGNDLVPNQDYEVELEILVDGSRYNILKRLNEVRSKARGKDEELSHKTSFFVNNHKMTATDFKAWVRETLMDENLFRAITNTRYFVSLKPDVQRSLLVDMVGLSKVEDVIASNAQLFAFYSALNDSDKDLAVLREHLSYEMTEIKKELDKIPERIKEQSNNLSEYIAMGLNFTEIEQNIAQTESELASIDKQMLDASEAIKAQAAKQAEALKAKYANLNDLKGHMIKIENEVKQRNDQAARTKKAQVDKAQDELRDFERSLSRTKDSVEDLSRAIALHEQNKKTFNEDYNKVCDKLDALDEETFTFDERSRYCPTCGQLLPDADIEAAHKRLQEEWNKRHAEENKRLQEQEQAMFQRADKLNALTKEYADKNEKLAQELDTAQKQYDKCKLLLQEAKNAPLAVEDFHNDAQWKSLNEEMLRCEAELSNGTQTTIQEADNSALLERKRILTEQRDTLKKQLYCRDNINSINKRIAELEKQEEGLNEQLAMLEGKDDMAQQINNAVIEDLESRVNSMFEYVQFKMFNKLLNGNIETTCVCTINGQPYPDANYAAKINAGIDIINTFSKQRQVYAPCFIDNAESINNVLTMDCQQILLQVTDDNEIIIESI